jgi:hypothetical protein
LTVFIMLSSYVHMWSTSLLFTPQGLFLSPPPFTVLQDSPLYTFMSN